MLNNKVILKYILIHLAELVLVILALILIKHFLGIPAWLVITVIALWIIKDVVLFFKVWKAYAFDDNSPMRELIGLEATVIERLDPVGYVRAKGELWKAEIRDPRFPAERGDSTRVVDVSGMTLVVEGRSDRARSRSVDAGPR